MYVCFNFINVSIYLCWSQRQRRATGSSDQRWWGLLQPLTWEAILSSCSKQCPSMLGISAFPIGFQGPLKELLPGAQNQRESHMTYLWWGLTTEMNSWNAGFSSHANLRWSFCPVYRLKVKEWDVQGVSQIVLILISTLKLWTCEINAGSWVQQKWDVSMYFKNASHLPNPFSCSKYLPWFSGMLHCSRSF